MSSAAQYKDKINFYLSSLDELGEVLIDQEGSSGITKGVLRIILGTMMTSKGVIIGIKRTKCKILSAHGLHKPNGELKIDSNQKKGLLEYKNANLNKSQINKLFSAKSNDSLSNYCQELKPSIMVPLFYKENLLGIVALGNKFTGEAYQNLDKKILEIICNHLTDSLHNQELIGNIKDKRMELRLKVLELQTLFDISLSLSSVLDINELASEVLIRSVSTLNASSGFILRTQKNSPLLDVLSSFNVDEEKIKDAMFSKNSIPFKSIWKEKESVKISNDNKNPLLLKSNYQECIVSPIIGKRNILGCIVLGDKESREGVVPFEKNDINILEALSSQAGIAMDNAKLFEEINAAKRFNESIMGSIATSVITINLIGEVDSINKAAKNLFGDKSKSIIGEHYSYFFSKDKNICDAIDAAEHELETISELNSSLLTKSRNTKINYSVAPLKDQKNKHLGMVVAIEDITEQSKIKNTFKRYVSKSVVDQLLDDEQKLNLGGEEREVTVLFSDIRGFTAMSEKMKPREVVTTLNAYFSEMIDIIFKYDGTLDKIVGDELMVVFGAPISREDDADRAVKTAIGMVEALRKFNENRIKKNKVPINAGIGINKGKVVSGNIGSKDQMDYTVIGDTVNLGARLCSFAGPLKIIISKSVKDEIGDEYKTRKLAPIEVKGKRKPVDIFKVLT